MTFYPYQRDGYQCLLNLDNVSCIEVEEVLPSEDSTAPRPAVIAKMLNGDKIYIGIYETGAEAENILSVVLDDIASDQRRYINALTAIASAVNDGADGAPSGRIGLQESMNTIRGILSDLE